MHPVDPVNRRDALKWGGQGALALLATLNTPAWARAGQAFPPIPSWKTELRQLAPGVYAYTQASGPGVNNASLSNAGVIAGPEGLLAIDTLGPPIHAKAFRRAAMAATKKTFTRVVNTHHHRDHTNGNCFFAPAEIVAHAYCREATIQGGIPAKPYEDRPEWQEGMSELKLAPATKTLTSKTTYRYGDLVVELIPNAPAHTWGDVMVYLPQHRILFAGDILFSVRDAAGPQRAHHQVDRRHRRREPDGRGRDRAGARPHRHQERAGRDARLPGVGRQRAAQAARNGHVARPRGRRHQRRPVRAVDQSGAHRLERGARLRRARRENSPRTPTPRPRTTPLRNTPRYGCAVRSHNSQVTSHKLRDWRPETETGDSDHSPNPIRASAAPISSVTSSTVSVRPIAVAST